MEYQYLSQWLRVDNDDILFVMGFNYNLNMYIYGLVLLCIV